MCKLYISLQNSHLCNRNLQLPQHVGVLLNAQLTISVIVRLLKRFNQMLDVAPRKTRNESLFKAPRKISKSVAAGLRM